MKKCNRLFRDPKEGQDTLETPASTEVTQQPAENAGDQESAAEIAEGGEKPAE